MRERLRFFLKTKRSVAQKGKTPQKRGF
jgi:hypothetical protein